MTDEEERLLKLELIRMDLNLKTRQSFWETPRNIAILVGTVAAMAGVLGFKIGQKEPPPQTIVIQLPAQQAPPNH